MGSYFPLPLLRILCPWRSNLLFSATNLLFPFDFLFSSLLDGERLKVKLIWLCSHLATGLTWILSLLHLLVLLFVCIVVRPEGEGLVWADWARVGPLPTNVLTVTATVKIRALDVSSANGTHSVHGKIGHLKFWKKKGVHQDMDIFRDLHSFQWLPKLHRNIFLHAPI